MRLEETIFLPYRVIVETGRRMRNGKAPILTPFSVARRTRFRLAKTMKRDLQRTTESL